MVGWLVDERGIECWGAWAALRKVSIRTTTWLNWLYPL